MDNCRSCGRVLEDTLVFGRCDICKEYTVPVCAFCFYSGWSHLGAPLGIVCDACERDKKIKEVLND